MLTIGVYIMGTLMLVNPRKRARRKSPSRGRSAAQKAATRKLVALNRSKRRTNPAKRRTYRHHAKRRHNPVASYRHHARRARRRSRNPIGFSLGGITSLLKAGAIGAGGALAVDFAMGNLPLPATMVTRTNADGSTNYVYFASKAAFAVALGTLGKKLLGHNAVTAAEGAMVVNLYDFFRTMMPAGIKLGYFSPAPQAGLRAYIPGNATTHSRLGAYTTGNIRKLTPNTMAGVRSLNSDSSARSFVR